MHVYVHLAYYQEEEQVYIFYMGLHNLCILNQSIVLEAAFFIYVCGQSVMARYGQFYLNFLTRTC